MRKMCSCALVSALLVASRAGVGRTHDEPPAGAKQQIEALRAYYGKTAASYEFYRDAEKRQALKLVEKPVMKWANDDDWSGDVFVWTRAERPEVIGCILCGPVNAGQRLVFQEFHLLAEEPIAPADMPGRFRWAPDEGLKLRPLEDAPEPAETPALRLSQMRQLLRDFSAHMEANGEWELRLLPQPLTRYQPKEGPVLDGALFAFVWTKGTDPEQVLLLECRKTSEGRGWFYAPVRFTHREVWLKHRSTEVWRADTHREQEGDSTLVYTTRYLTTIDDPESGKK